MGTLGYLDTEFAHGNGGGFLIILLAVAVVGLLILCGSLLLSGATTRFLGLKERGVVTTILPFIFGAGIVYLIATTIGFEFLLKTIGLGFLSVVVWFVLKEFANKQLANIVAVCLFVYCLNVLVEKTF